jgi:hypothetical protein
MDQERKTLSLKEAYHFGGEHGLDREIATIRDMEIEWDLSYTSSLRRGFVVDLFKKKQLFDAFKEQYWPVGNTPWGLRKTEAWLRLKSRYEDFLSGRGESDPEDEDTDEGQAFAAEADLRDFLANNLDCVEPGLRLYHQDERRGVEFPVDDGRIDILGVDRSDRFVVFELKLARGRNKVLGQLLYYMGWVDKHLGKGPCRGIIVAKDISEDLAMAVKRVQGVSLYRYKLSVSTERVS